MFISTAPMQEATIESLDPPRPAPRPSARRTWKIRLLSGLTIALIALAIIHLIIVSLQSTAFAESSCTSLVHTTDYASAVHMQTQNQEMAAIQFADNLDGGAPAALVEVTTHNAQNTLDVYVFGCSLQQKHPHLTQLFAQRGLIRGTATISPTDTLRTSHLDTNLNPPTTAILQPFQQNIYQEYVWQQDRFVPRPFAGIYPVTSAFEAEQLQQDASKVSYLPWNDPTATAIQMSRDLLHLSNDLQPRLLSETSTLAVVELTSQRPRLVFDVTLKRLVQPTSTGIWFVTEAHTQGMTLTRSGTLNHSFQDTVASPIHFSGFSALVDGQTSATLFDHTLTPLSLANEVPIVVQPDSRYSATLVYPAEVSGQRGVLLIQSLPRHNHLATEAGQFLLLGVNLT